MGPWRIKRCLSGGADAPCVGPHRRSSHHPPRPLPTKDADDADGSRSDPSGELGSASVLAIDFSALRRAYLSERVCGKVGVEGVDGAPAAREAGQPALSPAKLASNFARSAARLAANPRLDSLLYCFSVTAEPPASGGRPDLDMALDIFWCYNLTPNPRHTRKDSNYRFLHT